MGLTLDELRARRPGLTAGPKPKPKTPSQIRRDREAGENRTPPPLPGSQESVDAANTVAAKEELPGVIRDGKTGQPIDPTNRPRRKRAKKAADEAAEE